MSARLYFPANKSVRIRPDFKALPVTIRLPRNKRPATVILALICVWGAVGTVGAFWLLSGMVENSLGRQILNPFLIALAMTASILLLGWRALRLYVVEDLIVVDGRTVTFTRYRLLPDRTIERPLHSFKGLRNHSRKRQHGDRTLTYQIIELVHSDPDMTLPIFVDRGSEMPPNVIRTIASDLGLPVIETGG